MLRLERDLAERMFKRPNGAMVIVATPTLAQGLNLPAHIAILAGDKRADVKQKGREDLKAHELLNAAARAGRAGHLANGIVLLVPEPIISIAEGKRLKLPTTVAGWLSWTVEWLASDDGARHALLSDVSRAALGACGAKRDGNLSGVVLKSLLPGLLAWIGGEPLATIEKKLGGNPNQGTAKAQSCPRARDLVGTVIPRGISFVMGLISHMVERQAPFDEQEDLSPSLVESLGVAVRKGLDSPEKVTFWSHNPGILSRVVLHRQWAISSGH